MSANVSASTATLGWQGITRAAPAPRSSLGATAIPAGVLRARITTLPTLLCILRVEDHGEDFNALTLDLAS
jgi:hypothetical protein